MSQFAYDVFLSFRGEDTRKTFTDHLYTALKRAGFRTFRDDEGIERGENIKSELRSAIQQSKISIVVLSKDYASSEWCLDELVLILKQRKRTFGHVVLPLFYNVDPSQVRKQGGGFGEAFAVHEEKSKVEKNKNKNKWVCKLKGWRAALRVVADLSGMVLQSVADGHESKFVEEVVKFVGGKCNRAALSVPPNLVGIDDRASSINEWLQGQSTGVVTIYGIGGIGKTTIAKFLYNSNFKKFDGSSFLADVREFSKTSDGLVRLQKQLLSDILPGRQVEIHNVHEGIVKIKDALCRKRIFIVLDDVDHRCQLDALFDSQDWFFPGSKIIFTTRHKQLLKAHEVYEKFEVEKLHDDQSLELFSWHAFGKNHPIQGYLKHAWKVISYCKGLPLALKVLGSSLNGKSVDIWESALEKLKNVPDSEIFETLKISFDSLQDDHDKDLFLDIACFFVGEDKDYVTTVLDGCDFLTKVGVDNLIDRCLLTIDDNNKLMMHQLLQEMGREIVRQESPKEPGRRSRLWDHKANIEVLREKTATATLEGFSLSLTLPTKEENTIEMSNNVKRSHWEEIPDKSSKRHRLGYFSWLSMYYYTAKSLSSSDQVDFETDAFAGMHKLRLLQLNNVRLIGDYKCLPHKLKWLHWHGFSLTSIPDGFSLESLVVLDMQNSNLQIVWKGTKVLGSLKVIDLSHSHLLRLTPDFSGLPNIERLILAYCTNLTEIHESIGVLKRLIFFDLRGCVNLEKLPRSIESLKSLENLILSGCSKLFELPTEISKMDSLVFTSINESPFSTTVGKMKSLGSFAWSLIWKPRKNPPPIRFSLAFLAHSLQSLSVESCNITDDAFPRDFGDNFPLLHELLLSGNEFCSLPESIKSLSKLKSLDLIDCKRLQSLPELPLSITRLRLVGCISLEMVTNLPNSLREGTLMTYYCEKLVSGCGLFKLEPIKKIGTKNFQNLGLLNLESGEDIHIGIYSTWSRTIRKLSLQGLLEFGIFSISLPGNKIPNCLNLKFLPLTSSLGYRVAHFYLPSRRNCKIRGLNMCIIHQATGESCPFPKKGELYIDITNVTKDLKWVYCPTFMGIPDDGKDMTWLCHWEMENQLEGGDELQIWVHPQFGMQLKKFGIQVVYEKQVKAKAKAKAKAKGTHPRQNACVGYLSDYQLETDYHVLCHGNYSPARISGSLLPLPLKSGLLFAGLLH